jgi:hypothetical protein
MKFTEEKRSEIQDAILIRCSGTDYQTFQIEELDRTVDEIEELVISSNVNDCRHSWWWKLKNTVIGTICLKCRYDCR